MEQAHSSLDFGKRLLVESAPANQILKPTEVSRSAGTLSCIPQGHVAFAPWRKAAESLVVAAHFVVGSFGAPVYQISKLQRRKLRQSQQWVGLLRLALVRPFVI